MQSQFDPPVLQLPPANGGNGQGQHTTLFGRTEANRKQVCTPAVASSSTSSVFMELSSRYTRTTNLPASLRGPSVALCGVDNNEVSNRAVYVCVWGGTAADGTFT